jgi:hypothetical protein
MKKGLLILAAVAGITFTSCKENAADKVKEENQKEVAERDAKATGTPVMQFESDSHDFGTINEGDIVEHTFKFTNTGDAPLVISNAKASCGCTVPQWTKTPVAPGEAGEIKVKFNSSGRPNNQSKSIRVSANTASGQETLRIRTFVTPKNGGAAQQNAGKAAAGHEGHNH